jgi:flagellar motor switch protein FliG
MNDEGLQDSAILLMAIGQEAATEVFKYLGPKEVHRIGETMTRLRGITKDRMDRVLERFTSSAGEATALGLDTDEYLRTVLTQALGDEKAALLLDRILQNSDTAGIDRLKWIEPTTVAELIKNEHPQIIATILVHLERDQSSEILAHFSPRLRNDIVLRIATLEGVQPHALRELNDSLAKQLQGSDQLKTKALGGVRTAAEILNNLPTVIEGETVESIREFDPDLAQRIQDEMFKFDDLLDMDDRSIQVILREVPTEGLVIALKGADEPLRDKILRNMSSRAAEQLREDLELKGPVRLSEVESQQKEILRTVRRLAEVGEIVMVGRGEDSYV